MDNTVMSKTPFGQIGVINVHKPVEQLVSWWVSPDWPKVLFQHSFVKYKRIVQTNAHILWVMARCNANRGALITLPLLCTC